MHAVPVYNPQDYALFFQQGEERGFAWAFRSLYPALTLYAVKLVKETATAEEIASGAFVKTWQRHKQFNSPEGIKAYLYQVVRNDCLKWLQKQKKEKALHKDIGYLWAADFEKDHFQHLVAAETSRQLLAELEKLPSACREVFELLYVAGKNSREAAEELQVSVSTVKTQKARGLETLRKKLKASPLLPVLLFLSTLLYR